MKQPPLKPFRQQLTLCLMLLPLVACQTPAPKLQVDEHVDNRLQNPTHAVQAPEKMINVNARDKAIYTFLANAELAWQREDYAELNKIYNELNAYDPGNLRAEEGLRKVEMAQKHENLIAEAQRLMHITEPENLASDDAMAMETLKTVLLENSQHPKALPLYKQLLAKQAINQKAKLNKKLVFNQPISMEFRDVNLKMIFESLAKTTKINFF